MPIISPRGDFNADGISDIAISGIYDLKTGPNPYFLLVATIDKKTNRPIKLLFQEYKTPVFVYKPGTTGEADPKDQAFSASLCTHCENGEDYYWDKAKSRFRTKPWSSRTVVTKQIIETPAEEIPQDVVDKALKIVGAQPDVIGYVQRLQKQKKSFGTRVSEMSAAQGTYKVSVFEKRGEKEILYDEITVNLLENRIVRRRKG